MFVKGGGDWLASANLHVPASYVEAGFYAAK